MGPRYPSISALPTIVVARKLTVGRRIAQTRAALTCHKFSTARADTPPCSYSGENQKARECDARVPKSLRHGLRHPGEVVGGIDQRL